MGQGAGSREHLNKKHRAQRTGHRVWSKEQGAGSIKTKHRAQSTGAQSMGQGALKQKHRAQSWGKER